MSWKMKVGSSLDWASSPFRPQCEICDYLSSVTPCMFYSTFSRLNFLIFKNRNSRSSLLAQSVKDPAQSLLWLSSMLVARARSLALEFPPTSGAAKKKASFHFAVQFYKKLSLSLSQLLPENSAQKKKKISLPVQILCLADILYTKNLH